MAEEPNILRLVAPEDGELVLQDGDYSLGVGDEGETRGLGVSHKIL